MTLKEYELRMKAHSLALLDESMTIHLQAYLNQSVQKTKKVGGEIKTAYPNFESFFNLKERENELLGRSNQSTEKKNKNNMIVRALLLKANTKGGQDE